MIPMISRQWYMHYYCCDNDIYLVLRKTCVHLLGWMMGWTQDKSNARQRYIRNNAGQDDTTDRGLVYDKRVKANPPPPYLVPRPSSVAARF